VLSDQSLDALQSISDDLKTLRFDSSATDVRNLRQGDIIAATIHLPLLPYGALRRVESVEVDGDTVTVQTAFASLAEAVEEGNLHAELSLDEPLATDSARLGRTLLGPGQLIFPIDNVVLFDGDKDLTTTNDQITIDGNLTIEPDVIIDIDIAGFALQHASVELQGEVTANVTITAEREATITPLDETLLIVPFSPVVIPLGPIPVVLVPVLEIHAGASGTFSADLTANLAFEGDAAVGLEYDGSFGPVLEVTPEGSADLPDFQDGAQAAGKVWISAKFKAAVYGLAGVFAELALYGRADVDTAACPWWELYVGVDGSAGAFAEINVDVVFVPFDSSIKIFEWDTDPLNTEKLVADAGACAPSSAPGDIVTWGRSYGASGLEFPIGIAVTADGSALVAGTTTSFTPQRDATLMKIDSLGHISWQFAYDDLDAAIAVVPIEDGYFLLAGENTVSAFFVPPFLPESFLHDAIDPPAYLLRLDLNGSPVWARALASTEQSLDAVSLDRLPDGSVVVAGTLGDPPDSEDIWLARFAADGQLTWARQLADPGTQQAQSLIVDSAGEIVLLASAVADCDVLLKVDENGNALWRACYGSAHNNFAAELVETSDGYTLVGHLSNDAQLNHVDRDGNLLWARHLDSDLHEVIELPDGSRIEAPDKTPYDEAYAADVFPNGDLLVSGKTNLGEDADVWVLRLNDEGQAQWIRRYGGAREDVGGGWLEFSRAASTLAVTPDGGALIAGYSKTFSHAGDPTAIDLDTWILKIRGTGTVDLDAGSGAQSSAVGGDVYDVSHFGGPDTNVVLVPVTLMVEPFTPVVFSPSMEVARQGGPE